MYASVYACVIKTNPGNTQSGSTWSWYYVNSKYGSVTSTFYHSIEFTTFSFEAILFLNFVSIFMSFAKWLVQRSTIWCNNNRETCSSTFFAWLHENLWSFYYFNGVAGCRCPTQMFRNDVCACLMCYKIYKLLLLWNASWFWYGFCVIQFKKYNLNIKWSQWM